jgi:hypothetical protein
MYYYIDLFFDCAIYQMILVSDLSRRRISQTATSIAKKVEVFNLLGHRPVLLLPLRFNPGQTSFIKCF